MDYFNQLLDSYSLLKQRKLKIRKVNEQDDVKSSRQNNLNQGRELVIAAVQDAMGQGKPVTAGNRQNIILTPNPQEGSVNIRGSNLPQNGITVQSSGPKSLAGIYGLPSWTHSNSSGARLASAFFGGVEGGAGGGEGGQDPSVAQTPVQIPPEEQVLMDRTAQVGEALAQQISRYTRFRDLEGVEDEEARLKSLDQGMKSARGTIIGTRQVMTVGEKMMNTAMSPDLSQEERIEVLEQRLKSAEQTLKLARAANKGESISDHQLQAAMVGSRLSKHGLDTDGYYYQYSNIASRDNNVFVSMAEDLNSFTKERNSGEKIANTPTLELDEIPFDTDLGEQTFNYAFRGIFTEATVGPTLAMQYWSVLKHNCDQKPDECDHKEVAKAKKDVSDFLSDSQYKVAAKEAQGLWQLADDTKLADIIHTRESVDAAEFMANLKDYYVDHKGYSREQVDEMWEMGVNREGMGLLLLGVVGEGMVKAQFGDNIPNQTIKEGQSGDASKYGRKSDLRFMYSNPPAFRKAVNHLNKQLDKSGFTGQFPVVQGLEDVCGSQSWSAATGTSTELKTKNKIGDPKQGEGKTSKVMANARGEKPYSPEDQEFVDENNRRLDICWADSTVKTSGGNKALKKVSDLTSVFYSLEKGKRVKDVPTAAQTVLNAIDKGVKRINNPASIKGIENSKRMRSAKKFLAGSDDIEDAIAYNKVLKESVDREISAYFNGGKAGNITGDDAALLSQWCSTNAGSEGEVQRVVRGLKDNKQKTTLNNQFLYSVMQKVGAGEYHWTRGQDHGKTFKIEDEDGNWYYSLAVHRGDMVVEANPESFADISPVARQTVNSNHSFEEGDLMVEFLKGQQKLITQLLS